MTSLITTLLPLALLASSVESVEWLDDGRVKATTVQTIEGMMPDFDKAEKDLKARAKTACTEKDLGKPKIDGEVMVNAIGVTPEGERQVTLSATYVCR